MLFSQKRYIFNEIINQNNKIMEYTKEVGEPISLELAKGWTKDYRTANPGEIKAHYIGANIINDILAQDGCVGIRTYYALNELEKKELVMVGVNSSGEDLVEGIIADRTFPCPTACALSSPLAS
ncbi:MAG: hypothetical protein ACI9N1_001951 [Flavobacteriales bacterium]